MKKKILSFLLAVVMIAGMLPLGAITAFAEGDTPETLTLGGIINNVGGSYSGNVKWMDGYTGHEKFLYVTLNADEYSIETISSDFESKMATKEIYDHSGYKRWKTTNFNDNGVPVYEEEPNFIDTARTVDDYLNSPISLTLFDMDVPICSGGTVKVPEGSFARDFFAFYDIQNSKTRKLYLETEQMELTRVESAECPLRDVLDVVGGTYNYSDVMSDKEGIKKINVTLTLDKNEYCLESLAVLSDGSATGERLLYNAYGGIAWDVIGIDDHERPIYDSKPSFTTDVTIDKLLDADVTFNRYPMHFETRTMFGIITVEIPAGSYYSEELDTYFYRMEDGQTYKAFFQTIELTRTTPVHKHTYGAATYIWNDGLTQCTAYKTCPCGNAVIETVNTVKNGNVITATFSNEFETQVKTVPEPIHEHTYSENWSCDSYHHWHNSTCEHSGFTSGFSEHTFGEGVKDGNKTVYTCTECGYQKFVYNPAEDTEGEVSTETSYSAISLTLGSDISINFYMNLTDDARQNGTMTFDIGGRVVTGVKAKYNETKKKYYFSTPLNALEMNETVTATFNFNGIDYIQEYSVADYIEAIINGKGKDGKDYSDEMKALAKKIANYGHYAQTYLASIHKNVVIGDDGYAAMDKFSDVDINVDEAKTALANYKVTVTGTSDNLSLYGSTVYLDSATALNYYVTVKNDTEPTATAVNTKTGKEKDVEIKLYKDNIYIVSVKDIIATELADDIEVTINGEITLTGSVFAYCNSVVKAHSFDGASEKDTFAVNAMAAFYEYYEAAMEYISFELYFDMPEHYKVFTADGEEITGDTTVKCYRTFSFRLVPDENYKISRVISGWDIEPDENGLYTVSYVGGKHDVAVYTKIDSYCLTVKVEGEDAGEMPDTKISFVCEGDETIYAQCFTPGIYEIEIPKGKSGTIVVEKSGYKEYSQEFTADGKVEEITVNLIPND